MAPSPCVFGAFVVAPGGARCPSEKERHGENQWRSGISSGCRGGGGMSMAGRELVASLRVNRLDTKVLVYLVRRRVAEGMPLDDVERAYEEAMAPFAEAWPPDDRPVPWEVIHAERRRLGPLRLPVTYRDLPRNPHQSGVVKPPPKDAVRHAHLAWTREAVRQRPGLWEADRLLPTD